MGVRRDAGDHRREPAGPPVARVLAGGEDWRISEQVCRAGPQDRPFEERHEEVTIAAVVAGSFRYRCSTGEALLYPGALLLGNAGTCFECGHDHSTGDRCIAFHFAPETFAEIAAAVTGAHRFRFAAAMLPASRALTAPLGRVDIHRNQTMKAAIATKPRNEATVLS
ncbi:MAG: AraC family ligand binding domain-containing protein [Stellaceae bacterium]